MLNGILENKSVAKDVVAMPGPVSNQKLRTWWLCRRFGLTEAVARILAEYAFGGST